jgi:hypothetical protein
MLSLGVPADIVSCDVFTVCGTSFDFNKTSALRAVTS